MSLKDLTPRQRQIYQAIAESIEVDGMPPTRAELAKKFRFASPNAVQEHLIAMQRKGVLELVPAISRGIKLLNREPVPL